MSINFLLVDALNLIRRVYAAQPGEDGPERVESALTSCAHSLQRALRECGPSHAVCVFEGEGLSWRHGLYTEYKAGRPPMPEALQSGLTDFKESFSKLGVSSFCRPALEADDVIATLAVKVALRKGHVVILSTDKMFLQLLSHRISVRDHFQHRNLDPVHVEEKFGVSPERFVDFLALAGDSTNNIKGVPGIGPKRAAGLLNEFGSLDRILSEQEAIPGKPGRNIGMHVEDVRRAQTLVRLKADLELGLNLKDLRYRGIVSSYTP